MQAPAGGARGAAVGVDVREGAVAVVGGNELRREHDHGVALWVCVVLIALRAIACPTRVSVWPFGPFG